MVEKVLQHNREKVLFWMLLGIFILTLGFYIFFVNSTVKNVVAREDIETKILALNLSISNKEFKYISNRNNITLALAHSLGFRDVTAKIFINEKSTKSVSLLSH